MGFKKPDIPEIFSALSQNKAIKTILKTQNLDKICRELVVIFMHANLLKENFRCVGMTEEPVEFEIGEGDQYSPKNWNEKPDVYVFRYKHIQSSLTFVLKCIPLGDNLIVRGIAVEDDKVVEGFEIRIHEFIDKKDVSKLTDASSPKDVEESFRNIDKLQDLIIFNISRKLVPNAGDSGPTSSESSSSGAVGVGAPPRLPTYPQQPPFIPFMPNPNDDDDDDDFDPLRIGPPRRPNRGPMFNVGDDDLYPWASHLPPPSAHFPGSGSSSSGPGNLVGPGHPMFGGVGPAGIGGAGVGRGGNQPLPPGVPPGARFDPFNPINPTGRGDPFNRRGPNHPDFAGNFFASGRGGRGGRGGGFGGGFI